MKKLLLVTAIGATLGLVGCGSGDEAPETELQQENFVNATRVVFDPSNGEVPVPSNILLSGSVDGTLNIPVADPADSANPQVAINGLDGWGTHSTLTFSFTLPEDENGDLVTVEPSSLEAAGSVRLFQTVMGGTAGTPEACATASPAATCAVAAELVHGEDFTVVANGPNGVAVIPLRPLQAKTGYLAVLTTNIQDSLGRDVKPSQTYALMKRPASTDPVSGDAAALGLQSLINSHEAALAEFGVDTDTVTYASSFTTQSVTDVFGAIKAGLAQAAGAGSPPVLMAADQGITVADALVGAGVLQPDPTNPAYVAASSARLWGGQIDLPYYLPMPTAENPTAPLTGRWRAACDSPASILGAIGAGAIDPAEAGIDPAALENPALLLPPNACYDFPNIDNERHLTKYNPIPDAEQNGNPANQTVPAVITIPDVATVNAIRTAQGQPTITEPADGWPVVIYYHGITGDKNNAFGIAGALSVAGFATVAIDHPLHGDRGFGAINASDSAEGNVTAYMNLGSLLTTRDNLRQSIADLLGLRVGLNFTNAPIDGSDVQFVGHSLGAIAGTAFTGLTNTPMEGPLAAANGLFVTNASTLAMPGGSIANFLMASPSFEPVVKSQLLYAAEPDFAAAVDAAAEANGIEPGSDEFTALLIQVYGQFIEGLSPAELAAVNGVFEQFTFAAQTVVDSGDPVNYASVVRASESPVHLIEVVGDGGDSLPDQVIPNTVAGKPLAGTEPLITLMELPAVSETLISEDGSPVSGAVRFTAGDHGSIVSPAASVEATTEMQTQVFTWFATDATVLPVANETVVQE